MMKDIGYGKGYVYDHDTEEAFSGQEFLPDEISGKVFYNPTEVGFEREISKRIAYWRKLAKQKHEPDHG